MSTDAKSNEWMQECVTILKQAESLEKELYIMYELFSKATEANDVIKLISLEDIPDERSALMESIIDRIHRIKSEASDSIDRYNNAPLHRFGGGYQLSEEAFYVLQAKGAFRGLSKGMGLSPVDDFELFTIMHYEDDDRRAWINPAESPRQEGRVKLRIGVPPEEVSRAGLRPEQREFFLKYLPVIYERFAE